MGRSKFPGKPSKSVMKERIRVLYKNEHGKSEKCACNQKNETKTGESCSSCNFEKKIPKLKEFSLITCKLNDLSSVDSKIKIQKRRDELVEKNDEKQNQKSCSGVENEENKESTTGNYSPNESSTSTSREYISAHPKCSSVELDKLIKKKTVTFKSVLEVSDETLVKKKNHNVVHKGPLVSIMKKECPSLQNYSSRGDGIVRPSRLTEILKNNENIDKTKSLSFRLIQTSNKQSSDLSGKEAYEDGEFSTSREGSNKLLFSNEEKKKCNFDLKKQNENIDKREKQSNESTNQNQSLDKWKLNNFSPLNDVSEYWEPESHKKPFKKKDNTLSNKIILRQPRLHFEPRNENQSKGKQSTLNSCSTTNLLGTSIYTYAVCGVCNTAVNSKNLQNQKYGIIACDPCRKFISKITKKTVSSSTNPITTFRVHCSKMEGECAISSLPKNNVKSFKKIYDERCSACWLKKCIKAFHFPSGHKLRLNAILTETHKNKVENKPVNKSFSSLYTSANTFTHTKAMMDGDNNTNSDVNDKTVPLSETSKIKELKNGDIRSDNNVNEYNLEESPCDKLFGEDVKTFVKLSSNDILNKTVQAIACKNNEQHLTNESNASEYPKRQKIDFKGPRVKHVCRSASIALGQQIATFSNNDEENLKLSQAKTEIESTKFATPLFGKLSFSANDQENFSQKVYEDVSRFNKLQENGNVLKQGFSFDLAGQKTLSQKNPFTTTEMTSIKVKKPTIFDRMLRNEDNNGEVQKSTENYSSKKKILMLAQRSISSLSKRNLMRITNARKFDQKSKLISIDFLDGFVPAEVNQTGFGLILTEPAPVCALCFLCGSMDFNYLLFCASCCEPYHSYCIQDDNNALHQDKHLSNINQNNLIDQLNWICPRCTVCYTCNMSFGAKVKCQKCKKNYHSTCMGTSKGLLGADRPLICKSCLKCQLCSTTKVSKYVGNQPICTQCFKLRMGVSRCPLCNNLFDNILDLIILECGICKRLIHAKCEGLTEEQSNLLSNLPGSIKFACKKCSLESEEAKILAKKWRDAVYDELRSGLLDILKLLSGSRQAGILKKNKYNNCLCTVDSKNKTNNAVVYNGNCKRENFIAHEKQSEPSDCLSNNLLKPAIHSQCMCLKNSTQCELHTSLSLFDIKKKINNREYVSLFDFNADMNDVIIRLKNDDLILAYKEILSEKFSWFQNETKTCTDALEEDMFESNYVFPLEEIVTEDYSVTIKLLDSDVNVLDSLKQEVDNRVCALCQKEGDGGDLQESRLLYNGNNSWIHANCAIWSNEVYEEFDGTLQNVHNALNGGRLMKCMFCNILGATIKCFSKTCCSFYHFQCARKSQCIFTTDKSVYCSDHCNQADRYISNQTFTVFRPLYIDLDKTYKNYVDPCKVQFMLGSLSVIQLGTVCPKFSDTSDAIVPINFMCTRLYWSSREPWKVVKYSVRTSIQHNSVTIGNDVGKNFTVDHSNNASLVEIGLSQIASWHNTLSREENLDENLQHDYSQFNNLRFSADCDNYNETNLDVVIDEEPQNNSDLLPPEIKDAIFEDLPHDILDGISMLDIFPKLMIYEDLITIEGKSDNMQLTESSGNSTSLISEEYPHHYNKQDTSTKFSYNVMNTAEDLNETAGAFSLSSQRELQRSSSEVFFNNFEGLRNQQRSSNATWGCKVDNARRYFTKGISDSVLSDDKVFNSAHRKSDIENDDHKVNSKKHFIFEDNMKLIQLDGTDDQVLVQNITTKAPVKCERCRCTYRTFDSFQRHLITCEQISTSESETETISRSPDESPATIMVQDDSFSSSIQTHQNAMANNHKFPANITVVRESNVISPDNFPQSIYVSNSSDCQNEVYVNTNKTLYEKFDNRKNIKIDIANKNECENNSTGVSTFHKSINKNKKYNFININNEAKSEQCKVITKNSSEAVPEIVETINNKTDYSSLGKHNYLHLLNQQLVLNNQYSQKEQQSQQQQYVVIQQSVNNNQPLFIQPVANPIPQTIFPVVLSNNSMQYSSLPTSTSSLVQGPVLQTDGSGNVILSSGLQMLPMPSLQLTSQSSPHLIGTFNQAQPLHLGSSQMFIGGPSAMELMPNANQVVLATQPVYYGLETIVQNTVMSSQQFVSTAVQGVLSQNASFSATTTQVFQSSKFEPVSDAHSGYVVLNNADGTAVVVPQSNLLPGFVSTNGSHDYHSNYTHDYGNICVTPQTFLQQPASSSVLPIVPALTDITSLSVETPLNEIQSNANLDSSCNITLGGKGGITPSPEMENLLQKNNSQFKNSIRTPTVTICNAEDTPIVTNNHCNNYKIQVRSKNVKPACKQSSDLINVQSKNRVEVCSKQIMTQKYIKRNKAGKMTDVASKLIYKKRFKISQSKTDLEIQKKDINEKIEDYEQHGPTSNTTSRKPYNTQFCGKFEQTESESPSETSENSLVSAQNTVPRIINRPMSQFHSLNTKSPLVTVSFGSNFNHVPTNIVAPILQTNQNNSTPSRPTNRVLPMQSMQKPVEKLKQKTIALKRPLQRDSFNKLDVGLDVEIKKASIPSRQILEENEISVVVPEVEENLNLNVNGNSDKLAHSSDSEVDVKKIMHNIINSDLNEKNEMNNTSNNKKPSDDKVKTLIESTTQLQKPNNEGFSQNKCLSFVKNTDNTKTDPKYISSKQSMADQQSAKRIYAAVPKKRLENENIKKPPAEPYLVYEIQSEDGFSYKSKSIAEVWEKVFEAVQNARRTHGLSSLPIGPFADMCGVQMLGLKTNALKYLIEQLPGTERCTKYIPKYHKKLYINSGNDIVHQDQDDLLENINGAVRCEPFKKRSDYDLFSWLASTHRKQPKQIFVQPSDTELIARRCTANLPMAMKYRTLKETCKYNIGVFRSLIHGRGLFCTKDIEAGEMVIEYAGELIRSTLTDKRERFYDSKGIGCYMFKIDENFVVDATMRGNAARFINHSCEPNCYSKVVDILGHKHIIIFSLRRIVQGEELTYDYKFPFEDIKIPCSCGSKKCRKYLN